MSVHKTVFQKIIDREVSAYIIYEDADFIAFLDHRPQGPGHTLVVPKKPYRWVWDIPNIGRCFEIVQMIAQAQKKAFGVDLIRSQVFGDEVPHAHVWVWPHQAEADPHNFERNQKSLIQALEQI